MSDSEDSVPSPRGSEKSANFDETIETMPIRQNHNGEEIEKLLQSMIVTHSVSEEDDQLEGEDNANDQKVVGGSCICDYINCTIKPI